MLLSMSGLPGSGTTTVSKLLAEHYGVDLVNAGDVFRGLAKEHGMTLAEFGALAESDASIDVKIDERQKEIANTRDDIILEGRLAGHMAEKALKVWIKAPINVRVKRISGREGASFDVMLDETIKREASEAVRYKEIYEIDIEDMSVYDLVIDSGKWDQFEIVKILMTAIETRDGFA
ncbi:MAG: AAA family ATPase [Deltaproteobacteria bacterium]|nr:AAA family ATPase [Deltaproteobacteria bacterium]